MFLKSKTPKPPRSTDGGAQPVAFAVVAPNLLVQGHLLSDGQVHVDGTVEGDVRAEQLSIGSSGSIVGRVFAKTLQIAGRVEGQINAGDVSVSATAVVEGLLQYQSLSVERGARLMSRCEYIEAWEDSVHPALTTSVVAFTDGADVTSTISEPEADLRPA